MVNAIDDDLSHFNLTSLKLFEHDITQTIKEKIDSTSNRKFNQWFNNLITDDIDSMINYTNHVIARNQQIYSDILNQSPVPNERKVILSEQIDGAVMQTTNEIAAESLKARRLLFNYQSIYTNYEKFATNLFRQNGLMHTEQVVNGVQNILSHLFVTLNVFSSMAIDTIEYETKAVIENRPTHFDRLHNDRQHRAEIKLATLISDQSLPIPSPTVSPFMAIDSNSTIASDPLNSANVVDNDNLPKDQIIAEA